MSIAQFYFLFKILSPLLQLGILQWYNYLITSEKEDGAFNYGDISVATKLLSSDGYFLFTN